MSLSAFGRLTMAASSTFSWWRDDELLQQKCNQFPFHNVHLTDVSTDCNNKFHTFLRNILEWSLAMANWIANGVKLVIIIEWWCSNRNGNCFCFVYVEWYHQRRHPRCWTSFSLSSMSIKTEVPRCCGDCCRCQSDFWQRTRAQTSLAFHALMIRNHRKQLSNQSYPLSMLHHIDRTDPSWNQKKCFNHKLDQSDEKRWTQCC